MRGILINPQDKTITEVDYTGDFHNIYKHIDAELFDIVRIDEKDTIFVDDEGLINGKASAVGMFRFDGDYPAYLAGKGLVLGTRGAYTIGTSTSLEDIRARVVFGAPIQMNSRIYFAEPETGKLWEIDE